METALQHPVERSSGLPKLHLEDEELVHQLSRRLDFLCHYAECIANAEGDAEVQRTWRDLEQQEIQNIRRLKELIVGRIEKGEFLDDL